ncbi:hypothetical protein ACE6H2_001554 [Prunus campanulata]
MGGFKRGLFGECFWKSGDGVTTLGCSLCMQESCRGHATFLRLPGCCIFEALKYVADVCPHLTALSLPIYLVHQRPRIIPQLIAKWKHLEELSLGSSLDLKKTLSEISIHRKKFWRLHVANAYIGNAEALAIVKLAPDIKHLSLRRADIGRDNIVMLLQGCKELVVLNFSDCEVFTGATMKYILLLLILLISGVRVLFLIVVQIAMITMREMLSIFVHMNLIKAVLVCNIF